MTQSELTRLEEAERARRRLLANLYRAVLNLRAHVHWLRDSGVKDVPKAKGDQP